MGKDTLLLKLLTTGFEEGYHENEYTHSMFKNTNKHNYILFSDEEFVSYLRVNQGNACYKIF